MEALYVIWGLLLLSFIFLLLVMRTREDKVARRNNAAVDPMFRRPRLKGHQAGWFPPGAATQAKPQKLDRGVRA